MEKLIELLNEYNRNVLKWSDKWELKNSIDNPGTKYISLSSVGAWKIYLWIISREYGFIKWLVDNDKIDLEELDYEIRKYNSYIDSHGYYDALLMLLSIQDNPLDFLVKILK